MTTTLIKAALLADGVAGVAKRDQAVLVTGERIRSVGPVHEVTKQTPPECAVVDLGSCCLAPGLIDGHTHLSLAGDGRTYAEMFDESDEMMTLIGAMNLHKHLRAGITTIREHGARNRVGFVCASVSSPAPIRRWTTSPSDTSTTIFSY